jgi:hypothetical protein
MSSNAAGTQPDGVAPWSTAMVVVGEDVVVEGGSVVAVCPQAATTMVTVTEQKAALIDHIGSPLFITTD